MLVKKRQSNIEFLRIIAITMVLMLHFNVHGLHQDVLSGVGTFTWSSLDGHLIESICICAVNVFVLISGYFTIKLSLRSIINLYIRCFIIGLVTYLAYILIVGEPLSITTLGGRLLAFTHNHWWFVISYLGLMAISPILNAGCEILGKKNYLYVLAMLSVAMIYFGWYKHLEMTYGGYSLIHFIFLYIIARYIKLHVSEQTIDSYRWLWLGLYFAMVGVVIALAYKVPQYAYTYDNPVVIAQAACLLLFFVSIPFQNRYVNWAAASVFSAYLLQESPYLGKMWLYPNFGEMIANGVLGGGAMLFAIFTIGTLIGAIMIDKFFVIPLLKISNRIYDKVLHHSTAV